jgi:cell division protein FtsB
MSNRLFIFISLASILFSLKIFVFGDKGILAKKDLEKEYNLLNQKLEKIQKENRSLEHKLQNLEKNPDLMKKEAYNLLILEKNDFVIKFMKSDSKTN